jgi:predicted neuraminidase
MFSLFLSLLALVSTHAAYEESFISAPATQGGLFAANHSSTLVWIPDTETIISCWYAGEREGSKDVSIVCSDRDSRTANFSPPRIVVASGEKAEGAWLSNKTLGNPVLFLDREKVLWLFYTSVSIGGWAGGRVDYKISRDFGRSWTNSKRLVSSLGNLTRGKPLSLADGTFMLPLYHEFLSKSGYSCIVDAHNGEVNDLTCSDIPGQDHLQPSLVAFGSGIFAYLRSSDGSGMKMSRFNLSAGREAEWANPTHLDLPNPDSSVAAETSSAGDILLVFNDSPGQRVPLTLARSKDGIHFDRIWEFEKAVHLPDGNIADAEYSYPTLLRTPDGVYHLSYTYDHRHAIKYIRFDDAWLSAH